MQKGLHPILLIALMVAMLVTGCKKSEPEAIIPTLTGGMSQAEVCEILGKPNGSMTADNKTTLLFNGIMLEFLDDHLVPLSADVKYQVDQRISGISAKKAAAAPPAKKKTIMSVIKPSKPMGTDKVTHPLAVKSKKAMYEAARAGYLRQCAATGEDPNAYPSYEEWSAEN